MPRILEKIKGAAIEDIIFEIKKAVDLANQDAMLQIKSVEIGLKVVAAGEGGIEFSVPLISDVTGKIVGGASRASEITITFEPKPAKPTNGIMPDMTEAIRQVKEAIEKAKASLPNLAFKSAVIKLNFTVTQNGGINFILKMKEDLEGVHSLKIEFGRA
jgi:hypothetical protein